MISSFSEPVPTIAVQIAALIAKIARLDCPKDWPEIIPTLLGAIQNPNPLEQHRALLVLQHVIKALATKRLISDRKAFEALTGNVYTFVLNLWDHFTTAYFQSLCNNGISTPELTTEYIEKALLALRIMRKLTIYGVHKPHNSEQCMLFIKSMFPRLKDSLEYRLQLKRGQHQRLTELTEKFILKQMKILNEFLELHPLSFIDFIPTALEFSFNYVFNEGTNMIFENNEISFTNFAIHCVNLMKGILASHTYMACMPAAMAKESGMGHVADTLLPAAVAAKQDFFTAVRLKYICEKVIMHYFLLTQQDLELWDEDPEAFASDEGGESWKYALRV